jgi:hypothetical protein
MLSSRRGLPGGIRQGVIRLHRNEFGIAMLAIDIGVVVLAVALPIILLAVGHLQIRH